MINRLIVVIFSFFSMLGCTSKSVDPSIDSFVSKLRASGISGNLQEAPVPIENIDLSFIYQLESSDGSQVISIFKFIDIASAKINHEESKSNTLMKGQTRNELYLMSATFFPEDDEKVHEITSIFSKHDFN